MGPQQKNLPVLKCSYCEHPLTIDVYSRNKAVPTGAIDLGIKEEVIAFKCDRCNNKIIGECFTCECGKTTDTRWGFEAMTEYGHDSSIIKKVYRCPFCASCDVCKEPILEGECVTNLSWSDAWHKEPKTPQERSAYQFRYVSYRHQKCHALKKTDG